MELIDYYTGWESLELDWHLGGEVTNQDGAQWITATTIITGKAREAAKVATIITTEEKPE